MKLTRRLGRGGRPLRIGYGRIFHEACAFSPLVTTRADFESHAPPDGRGRWPKAASLRGAELKSFFPHAELTGFQQAARLAGGVEAVPLSSSAMAVPGGPARSRVLRVAARRRCWDASRRRGSARRRLPRAARLDAGRRVWTSRPRP
jgi:hypothetical protein